MYHEVWNKKRERIKKNDILFDRITGIWLQLNWKKPLRAVRRNSCLLNSKTSKPYSKTSEPYSRRTKPYRMQDWQISRWDRESESWSRVNVCVRWRGITSVCPSNIILLFLGLWILVYSDYQIQRIHFLNLLFYHHIPYALIESSKQLMILCYWDIIIVYECLLRD